MSKGSMSRIMIITGASSGIGAAAARKLHQDGHHVVIVGRSPQKTRAIAREIGAEHFLADFSTLEEVRGLAADLLNNYPRIDVLANNAGGIFGNRTKTVDGFEETFQVNHLAPFLLTQLLMTRLIESNAAIIQTSSVGARMTGRLVINDLNNDTNFSAVRAYGTAKLENILFTKELHRRYHSLGISAAAFHPGSVASNFATESHSFLRHVVNSRLARMFMVAPEKGAEQLVWLAETTPGVDWASGTYYEKHKPARRNNPQALDEHLGRRLWDRSEQLVGKFSKGVVTSPPLT